MCIFDNEFMSNITRIDAVLNQDIRRILHIHNKKTHGRYDYIIKGTVDKPGQAEIPEAILQQ